MSFMQVKGAAMRSVAPSHSMFVPDEDQEGAIRWFVSQYIVAGFCDIGSGKTAITLEAFRRLKELRKVKTILVVATVRVIHETWPPEIAKWTQFRGLKVAMLHGKDKDKALKSEADVYLINYEGLAWLSKKFFGRSLPFDIVAFDEISKMRNSQSERFKAMKARIKGVRHRWGLTGTPTPNGYDNLFGQMLILDGGAALGPYITHFRDKYFVPSYDGFGYLLKAGADKMIEARIKPYVVRIQAKNLPPVLDVPHVVKLPPTAQKTYNQMKKDMLTALEGRVVSAVNAGAAYSKMLQMANGAVYVGEAGTEGRDVIHLHDEKINALGDIIGELNGAQMLVCYAFKHDLDRLLQSYPGTPYIGGGTSTEKARGAMAAWNSGRAPLMFIHPASAGHGLNLQLSGAHHICWFGLTWDRELYDQAIGRLVRRGNDAATVYNHLIMVDGSLDVDCVAALKSKDDVQQTLLDRLHKNLHSVDGTSAAEVIADMENEMSGFKKLSRQDDDKGDDRRDDRRDDRSDDRGGKAPAGWGGKAGGDDDRKDDRDDRRDDRGGRERDDRDRDDRGDRRDARDARGDDRGRDDDRSDSRRDDRRDRDDDRRPRDDDRRNDRDERDQKDRVLEKVSARDEPIDEREPVAEQAKAQFKRNAMKDDDRRDEKEPPEGWSKPPEAGDKAEPVKEKRTRAKAADKPKDDPRQPADDAGEQVTRLSGKTGDAVVGYDMETGNVHLQLSVNMPLSKLAQFLPVLERLFAGKPPF